jgi:hypothetical protein
MTKREFRLTIGDEQRPSVGVAGTVDLKGSLWVAEIQVPDCDPYTAEAVNQIDAVLWCIRSWAVIEA